jgi:hypothetical protein
MPIRLTVDDDLKRSRLTVFFRLLLAIPHLLWLSLWGSLAILVAIASWIATLITGRSPDMFHGFIASFLRYSTHVFAYLFLAANPFPGFTGRPSSYPIDLEIKGPEPQNRWLTGFRIFVAMPALLLADVLLGGGFSGGAQISAGAGGTVAFLGWFFCLARARMPEGFRNLIAYALAYSAQTYGYLFLLTDRYPNPDPGLHLPSERQPPHPIRLAVDDDLRRSRLTVFFRLLLAVPHFVWLALWGLAMLLVVIANWFATLLGGRAPSGLHRFITSYLRYATHLYAYLYLLANPFPGFTGRPGSYPIEVEIDGPERQNRWLTGFRLFIAIPALLIAGALGTVTAIVALFGWFVSLVRGRMPEGLRNLGAYCLRYSTQAYGYVLLLHDRYPYAGPAVPGPAQPPATDQRPEQLGGAPA